MNQQKRNDNRALLKFLPIIFTSLAFSACAVNSVISNVPLSKGEFAYRMNQSPIVEYLKDVGNTHFSKLREPQDIELHFMKFNLFNKPDLITNWKYHYVLGEPSSPQWDYIEIADITVYQLQRDDAAAFTVIRKKVSEIGGSGVIDMFRKPIHENDPTARTPLHETWAIEGYLYSGRVVREKGKMTAFAMNKFWPGNIPWKHSEN